MKLRVGDKTFSVKVAETPESKKRGLTTVREGSMPKTAGLVLKYETPTPVNITMVGMKFSIDIIFVKNYIVQKVVSANPGESEITINDVSDLVLEVPQGSAEGIKPKDSVEWVGEKTEDGIIQAADGGVAKADGAMYVLDENGKVQMNIEGMNVYSPESIQQGCWS